MKQYIYEACEAKGEGIHGDLHIERVDTSWDEVRYFVTHKNGVIMDIFKTLDEDEDVLEYGFYFHPESVEIYGKTILKMLE